jgi:small GTP-binding protein
MIKLLVLGNSNAGKT